MNSRTRQPLLFLVITALVVLSTPTRANAYAQPTNFTVLGWSGGPVWANYDERSALPHSASPRDADFPIDFYFWNFAEINKVKDAMDNWYSAGDGSTKYLDMYTNYPQGSSESQDQDDGLKTPDVGSGCNRYNLHFRVYAPADIDAFYHTGWGYFVVGSNHYDINEECPGAVFGYSETAEDLFIAAADDNGFPVVNDTASFFNPICYPTACQDGDHIWQNDGYASAVNYNILP